MTMIRGVLTIVHSQAKYARHAVNLARSIRLVILICRWRWRRTWVLRTMWLWIMMPPLGIRKVRISIAKRLRAAVGRIFW